MPDRAATGRRSGQPVSLDRALPIAWQMAPAAATATIDPPSPVHAVALVVCLGVLIIVQAMLIRRTLDARKHVDNAPPGESPARELVWAALPAVLLLGLLLYSLRYARFI